MLSKKRYIYLSSIFFLLYLTLNLFYLTQFPFVHSDESWLSGLSRNILQANDFSVTEPFFDLKERHPHAIKVIFHLIQIVFIKFLGYNIFTMRFISFLFGILTLYFFFRLSQTFFNSTWLALTTTLFLALDVQFVYASHFARQEIIILFVLISSLYYFLKNLENHLLKHDIITASFIGLSIGIHPNSFIISLPLILIYLYHITISKKLNLKNLLVFILSLSLFALVFILLSLTFNPGFFTDYANQGKEFGVFNSLIAKVTGLKAFYLKLFYQISGTYYTPNIRFEFFLFGIVFFSTFLKLIFTKNISEKEKILPFIISIVAINIGIIIIGRFNQTSIILQFPMFYILLGYLISLISKSYQKLFVSILLILLTFNTISNAYPYLNHQYDNYLEQISKAVKKDAIVLANLNSEYFFENGKLYDYRNLPFLKKYKMTFAQYIKMNDIQYIIYPEEMDLIYQERPRWNGVYGNIYYFYDDMKDFIKNNCLLVHEFTDGIYGMRITHYSNKANWKIRIYQVQTE